MKKIIYFLCLVPFNLAFANTAPLKTQQYILKTMKEYNVVGSSIAVIKNYHIEWAQGFGYKNKEKHQKVLNSSLFEAASISKPLTAMVTLETFHKKHLSLDENVNKLLTHWKIPPNPYTKNQPVTTRLLLQHYSGITGFRFKGYPWGKKMPTLLDVMNGKSPANTPPIVMVRKPGIHFEYSPAGY